jgi:hypothetical protein
MTTTRFIKGIVAGAFAGLYLLFFVTAYAIPCDVDPTDCSGRDMVMAVTSAPTFFIISFLFQFDVGIQAEMSIALFSGMLQYGIVGYVVSWFSIWFAKGFKEILCK